MVANEKSDIVHADQRDQKSKSKNQKIKIKSKSKIKNMGMIDQFDASILIMFVFMT